MNPYISDNSCLPIVVASLILCFPAKSGSTADPPEPTPRPGTLAAYAQRISLDTSELADHEGRIILTNDRVAGLAADGSITLGTVKQATREKVGSVTTTAERSRWQAAEGSDH